MWLTGFDVPTLATLYMDKPMQGHNLMQAIARANRVHEGKNNGLLIDYNGILFSLRSALAKYAKPDVLIGDEAAAKAGVIPYKNLDQLRDAYAAALQTCQDHLASLGFDLQHLSEAEGFDKLACLDQDNQNSAINAVSTNDEALARFTVMARDISKKHQALITEPALTLPFKPQHDAIEAIYEQIYQQQASADLNAVLRSRHGVVSELVTLDPTPQPPGTESGKLYNISEIDFDRLKTEFQQSPAKNTQVQTLKAAVEQQLKRMLQQNPTRIELYTRYQQIIDRYNQESDRAVIEQTFEELLKLISTLSEEDSRAVREGLTEEYLTVFDLLSQEKHNLDPKTRNRVKQVAHYLIEAIKAEQQHVN